MLEDKARISIAVTGGNSFQGDQIRYFNGRGYNRWEVNFRFRDSNYKMQKIGVVVFVEDGELKARIFKYKDEYAGIKSDDRIIGGEKDG